MKESTLRTNIVKKLNAYSGWWVVTHGAQFQTGGLPDIIGCYQSVFVGLEVKLPGKMHTLTPRQNHRLEQIRKAGGKAAVVTSISEAMNFVFDAP